MLITKALYHFTSQFQSLDQVIEHTAAVAMAQVHAAADQLQRAAAAAIEQERAVAAAKELEIETAFAQAQLAVAAAIEQSQRELAAAVLEPIQEETASKKTTVKVSEPNNMIYIKDRDNIRENRKIKM